MKAETDDKAIIPIEHKTASGETHLLLYSEGNELALFRRVKAYMRFGLLEPVDVVAIGGKILRGMVRRKGGEE